MRLLKPKVISKLSVKPATPLGSRAGLAIALMVKNEAPFVDEWVRFHHGLGVRHFIVYDDGSTDGTCEAFAGALPEGALTVIPWAQKLADGRSGAELHNQVLAFAHALSNFGPRFEWMAFVDVDEFIVPKDGGLITDALKRLEGASHVSLPWHMFGRSGHDAPPKGGVLENYLTRMAEPQSGKHALNWKCIVDPAKVTGVRVHGMEVSGRAEGVNDVGVKAAHKDRGKPEFYSNARLQLNHYYTRSDAELKAKLAKCLIASVDLSDHARRIMRIVDEIETETVEDRAALEAWERLAERG